MRLAEKAKLKAAKGTGVTQKTMELNWAIGKGDLGHGMGKWGGWLERGWRVEVVIAGKKKGRKATEEEARELLGAIGGVMAEMGGREMKPVEGKVLGTLTMFLEGKQQQQGKKAKKGGSDAAVGVQGEGSQGHLGEGSGNVDVDDSREVSQSLKSVEKGEGSKATGS